MLDEVEHFKSWKSILENGSSWLHSYSSWILLTINSSSLQNEKHVSLVFTKILVEPTKVSLNWSTRKDCNILLGRFCFAPVIWQARCLLLSLLYLSESLIDGLIISWYWDGFLYLFLFANLYDFYKRPKVSGKSIKRCKKNVLSTILTSILIKYFVIAPWLQKLIRFSSPKNFLDFSISKLIAKAPGLNLSENLSNLLCNREALN